MAAVGRIARAHGNRGQVIVNSDTDFPAARFREGAELFIERRDRGGPEDPADLVALKVTSMRFQGDRPVIAFDGVATMTEAEALAGRELRVPVEWLAPLPDGVFYRHDLVGCRVEDTRGELIGIVQDVEAGSSGSLLVVSASESKTGDEVLIPLAAAICRTIDVAAKRIVVDAPAGLLDVNK